MKLIDRIVLNTYEIWNNLYHMKQNLIAAYADICPFQILSLDYRGKKNLNVYIYIDIKICTSVPSVSEG